MIHSKKNIKISKETRKKLIEAKLTEFEPYEATIWRLLEMWNLDKKKIDIDKSKIGSQTTSITLSVQLIIVLEFMKCNLNHENLLSWLLSNYAY